MWRSVRERQRNKQKDNKPKSLKKDPLPVQPTWGEDRAAGRRRRGMPLPPQLLPAVPRRDGLLDLRQPVLPALPDHPLDAFEAQSDPRQDPMTVDLARELDELDQLLRDALGNS